MSLLVVVTLFLSAVGKIVIAVSQHNRNTVVITRKTVWKSDRYIFSAGKSSNVQFIIGLHHERASNLTMSSTMSLQT